MSSDVVLLADVTLASAETVVSGFYMEGVAARLYTAMSLLILLVLYLQNGTCLF